MIRNVKAILPTNLFAFCSATVRPILFSNTKSIISVSQWWNGVPPRPSDYYVEDTLESEIDEDWALSKGMFRVVFRACLNEPSMDININHLKRSFSLNQLIQLSATEKEKLVENPSTVIIKPNFSDNYQITQQQVAKNMLELDKLFESAVGLKTSYLLDWQSLRKPAYLSEVKKRFKAVSADVSLIGANLEDVVFQHGHKLQHVFYSTPYDNVCKPNMQNVLEAMAAIDFKGKLIFSGGQRYESEFQEFQAAAKKKGFSEKLQYSLETDGWYTMT